MAPSRIGYARHEAWRRSLPNFRSKPVRFSGEVEREKDREWVMDGQHGDGTIVAKVGP